MREFRDETGRSWYALGVETMVANARQGTRLAFRPADAPEEAPPLLGDITFNSVEATEFALRTLGEKELRRRLSLARSAAGGV